MGIFLSILTFLYIILTLLLSLGWRKSRVFMPSLPSPEEVAPSPGTLFSIIIPVRNEGAHIFDLLSDLNKQRGLSYLSYEVMVVNDESEDNTVAEVERFRPHSQYALQLLHRPGRMPSAPKKEAITYGIENAQGTWILTTDGDCRVPETWLFSLQRMINRHKLQCITAPVSFLEEKTLFEKFQTIEFASLVASGAATLTWGYPTMSNGANFAYRREAFLRVGGFSGFEHLASGDDEFLLHKIARAYPGQVRFLNHPDALVKTQAHRSWGAFQEQRKRWGSKWQYYKDGRIKILAFFIFAVHLSFVLAGLLAIFGKYNLQWLGIQLLMKWVVEWIFFYDILKDIRKLHLIRYVPWVQLLYPFYVCWFALASQRGSYDWKGRTLR